LADYTRIGILADFEPGVLYDRTVEGKRIFVVRYGERLYAMRNACTHSGYLITPGNLLEDGSVLCPAHGAVFRLEDGEPIEGPADDPLELYSVRIEGDDVLVAPQ
jgi:3-phenylpropionate/trans-cinnamate dioxygenase ferredoxin subunit